MPEPGRLYLVRHARAVPADDLRLPGANPLLRPDGREQARALAARLAPLTPTAVLASDAARARETGAIIAAACRLPLTTTPALRELDFGRWGGRTYAEVVAADPAAAAYFANVTAGAPSGGERVEDAAARVLDVLRSTAAASRAGAVVVGHAGSLRLAIALVLGMPLAAYWRLRLDCAGLAILDWTDGGPVVERWNDTGHLAPSGSA